MNVVDLIAVAAIGAAGVALWRYQKGSDAFTLPSILTPSEPQQGPQGPTQSVSPLLPNWVPRGTTRPDGEASEASTPAVSFDPTEPPVSLAVGQGSTSQILTLIKRHESGGNYDIIWSGINLYVDQPPKPITRMTIGEVLAWQDSIDPKYNSEAAGAYQILEDTLRSYYVRAGLGTNDLFSKANQDKIAIALMDRRGLGQYRRGAMSAITFAQNLSKEWASLPCQTKDKQGRPATGQSYYAGDGLNKSLTSKAAVMAAVEAI